MVITTLDIIPLIPAIVEWVILSAIGTTVVILIVASMSRASIGTSSLGHISIGRRNLLPIGGVVFLVIVIIMTAIFWPSYLPFFVLMVPLLWHYTAAKIRSEERFWGITWRNGDQYLPSYLMLQFLSQGLLMIGVILLLLLWGPWILAKSLQGSMWCVILGVATIFFAWFFESWGQFTRMLMYAIGISISILWLAGRRLEASGDLATIMSWRDNILELEKLFYF